MYFNIGIVSMDYIPVQEVADDWEITRRRVQILYSENRIAGAHHLDNMWAIQKVEKKPIDSCSLRYNTQVEKQLD